MKTIYYLLIFSVLIGFSSCQTQPLDNLDGHFHTKAKRTKKTEVDAYIKVPERFVDQVVFLESIKPVNEIRRSKKNREELVLAELTFTLKGEQEMKESDQSIFSWDQNCGLIHIRGHAPENVKIASLIINVPEGVEKSYSGSKKINGSECYNSFRAELTNPKASNYGFTLLHMGHDWDDPEFNRGGIPIEDPD